MENGVKNLKGARLFPKTFSNHGFGDASHGVFLSSSTRNLKPQSLHMKVNEFILLFFKLRGG
jgi:hypothetical protein